MFWRKEKPVWQAADYQARKAAHAQAVESLNITREPFRSLALAVLADKRDAVWDAGYWPGREAAAAKATEFEKMHAVMLRTTGQHVREVAR